MSKSIEELKYVLMPYFLIPEKDLCEESIGNVNMDKVNKVTNALRSAGCIMKHDIKWPGEREHGDDCKYWIGRIGEDCTCGVDRINQAIDQCRKAVETTTSD